MDDQGTTIRLLEEGWRKTSFRLEALSEYTTEAEEGFLGAFLSGEPSVPGGRVVEDWIARLRHEREQGRLRSRTHAIAGLLTPYLRCEIEWGYPLNVAAGEEVRILHRDTWAETPFGAQPPDFFLLDDTTVVVMSYDEVGHWLGGDVITDESTVARYREMRDQALAASVPLREYLAAVRRTPIPPPALKPNAMRASA